MKIPAGHPRSPHASSIIIEATTGQSTTMDIFQESTF